MLGPGIGGFEVVVIALVALIVVGPKDLPLLMRKVGQFLGRARRMAAEFRQSFDDMARQSELDELRKEVEALRSGQMAPLGKDAQTTLSDIRQDLNQGFKPSATLDAAPRPAAEPPVTETSEPAPRKRAAVKRTHGGPSPAKPRAPRPKKAP